MKTSVSRKVEDYLRIVYEIVETTGMANHTQKIKETPT
jgi:hypothetical protein